jgi:sulfur carrier protein ThiS
MPAITVHYHNVLRHRAGIASERLELPEGTTLAGAIQRLAGRHGPGLTEMLLAPRASAAAGGEISPGEISPHIVIFVNGQLVTPGHHTPTLIDGDELKLFLAVSGG